MQNLRLQAVPQAFLDALELKVEGRNPSEFSDVVAGQVDLMDHYLATRQAIGVADATVTNIGDRVSLTVPAGEMWRVHCVSVTVVLTAATLLAGRIAYLPTAGAVRAALLGFYEVIPATGLPSTFTAAVVLDRPLLALPGSLIQFALDAALAAPDIAAVRTLHEVIAL